MTSLANSGPIYRAAPRSRSAPCTALDVGQALGVRCREGARAAGRFSVSDGGTTQSATYGNALDIARDRIGQCRHTTGRAPLPTNAHSFQSSHSACTLVRVERGHRSNAPGNPGTDQTLSVHPGAGRRFGPLRRVLKGRSSRNVGGSLKGGGLRPGTRPPPFGLPCAYGPAPW
jgi:hypothetical protein